jgi:hypothetical protein
MSDTRDGTGWVLFAGIMILIIGVLNCIWGIAAIDNANFFVANTKFIISNLNIWGWVTLVIGIVQLFAAFSVWSGGAYGRWIGVFSAAASCVASLLSIPAYPFWSLAVFSVSVLVIYGLVAYGGQRPEASAPRRSPPAAV